MATAKPKLKGAREKELKKYFDNPQVDICETCGLDYDDFRTGENFQSIYDTLWKASEDPSKWINKGRHTVLGRWHELKQDMWRDHLEQCEGEDYDAPEEIIIDEY